jgi:hypothetical protein
MNRSELEGISRRARLVKLALDFGLGKKDRKRKKEFRTIGECRPRLTKIIYLPFCAVDIKAKQFEDSWRFFECILSSYILSLAAFVIQYAALLAAGGGPEIYFVEGRLHGMSNWDLNRSENGLKYI